MAWEMSQIERLRMQAELALLPVTQLERMVQRHEWLLTARPDQLPPPGDWFAWVLLAGRGSGKTRAGAEEMWWPASGSEPERIAVVGPTSNDVRKTCFEGESGLLSVIPRGMVESYNRTSLELWLRNGTYFVGYSSEEPERLRGPQHHRAWCDEFAAWKYLEETWDMLLFGLRLGDDPRVVVTTTPKPSKVLRELLTEEDTRLSRASTFDNAPNLPRKFLEKLRKKYEGTRLGRQELHAEVLDDNPWALWSQQLIDQHRVRQAPTMRRIVVAIDPPVTTGDDADECGIVAAGVDAQSRDTAHCYVLQDLSVQGYSPNEWARRAVDLYHQLEANAIVAEVNNGGELIAEVIRHVDPGVPVVQVRASRGKVIRAEPVAALYEQGRVHHVARFGQLEDQMCDFTTDFDKKVMGYSPDRVDALVWAITNLVVDEPRYSLENV